MCSRANAYGIGCILDLHGLPGGANGGNHSGTNSGKAELWNNQSFLDLAQKCIEFLASEAISMENVIGIQPCNEAAADAPGMYEWYDSVVCAVHSIDSSMPIIISDGWNLSKAVDWVLSKNCATSGQSGPIFIDTHKYFCFTDGDESPQEIISNIPQQLTELDGKEGNVSTCGAIQVIVGEYSCVFSDSSWNLKGSADRSGLVKEFGNAQSTRWQQRAGGSYFWTYKMVSIWTADFRLALCYSKF
jgi:hypothetical protein